MKEDLKKIIYSLHPLERKVLPFVSSGNVAEISKKSGLSESEVTTGLQLLEAKKYVSIDKNDEKFVGLDKFGLKYLNSDLPEMKFLKEIISGEKKMSELSLEKDEFGTALGILKRNNLIDIRKEGEQIFTAKVGAKKFLDEFSNPLILFETDVLVDSMDDSTKKVYSDLKRRTGFLKEFVKKSFSFSLTDLGAKLADEISSKYLDLDLAEVVDSDMLKSGSWKDKEFRHYDVNLNAGYENVGRRHPMLEANSILSDIFVEMGFCEMEGPMVESALWNMDVMWIPQDHPARDEQDTFYLDGKADVPKELVKKVAKIHEEGIKKAHTPKGEWSAKITAKRLLRTHSTATSFRMLAELGERLKDGEDINGKYFYVANNFRNESTDATHLAEFFQGEGFIIGDDLSLADLMGFIREYYGKLGIDADKIKFKPTFNPYTEPSMEAHYFDEKMNKWYALINSGIFRAETLSAFGLENKRVIAWGMGASRVATLLANKASMREITGVTCDFDWLKNRPMMTRKIVRGKN